MEKGKVRIVVVGDQGVGKTSLITALVSNKFQEKVPPIVPPVYITPETTNERVEMQIIDTSYKITREFGSSKEKDAETTRTEMMKADAICVVYAINNPDSEKTMREKWLDPIKNILKLEVPIILVGNKSDLRDSDRSQEDLKNDMDPFLLDYPQVESCVECSAKTLFNIDEIFYFAQKSVLYPGNVLYDPATEKFKPLAITAMKRVFRLCDKDADGFWNDYELNFMQSKCFDEGALDAEAIAELKSVVRSAAPDGVDDTKGINLKGFLALQHLLLLKGRLETIWAVLRQFGYDDTVHLRKEFIEPDITPDLAKGERVELSSEAKEFLASLFSRGDTAQAGTLCLEDLDNIFSTAPENLNVAREFGFPDSVSTVTLSDGTPGLTLQGWMHTWAMATVLDYKGSFASLSYLGFQKGTSALQVKRLKDKKAPRSSLVAYVFGSRGAGKTSLLNKYMGRPYSDQQPHTTNPKYAVNSTRDLTLTLCELAEEEQAALESTDRMSICDCAVVVFDRANPMSWGHAQATVETLIEKFPSVPIVLVASKSDLNNETGDQVKSFTKSHGVPQPVEVSCRTGQSDVHTRILETIYAYSPKRSGRTRTGAVSKSRSLLSHLVLGVTAAAAIGTIAYCLRTNNSWRQLGKRIPILSDRFFGQES